MGQEEGGETKICPAGAALSRSCLWNMQFAASIRVPEKEKRCVGGNEKSIGRINGSMSGIRENSQETRSAGFILVQRNRARVIKPAAGAASIVEIAAKSMFSFFLAFDPWLLEAETLDHCVLH